MKAAPKVMPILLCWLSMSETDIGDLPVENESSFHHSVSFYCVQQVAMEG